MLPGVLCAVLALAAVLGLLLFNILGENSQSSAKVRIGLVGTTEDPILQMGMTALQTLDDTRYSVELAALTEPEAEKALEAGKLAAYAVIPEDFMEEAMYGRFLPLKFVSTTGASGVVSIFKEEFTQVIGDMLSEARKGVYGIAAAMDGREDAGTHMNDLALEYVELVFLRSRTYQLRELGIVDDLGLDGYLLCGLTVLLLTLLCLPFAPLLVGGDRSLSRLLTARGICVPAQIGCEYLAYFSGCLILTAALALLAGWIIPESIRGQLGWHQLIPAVFAVTAISYLLCQLAKDIISGVMLQFLVFLAMAFVSGCMYPVFFFPEGIQRLAQYLPTGIARSWLASGVTGGEGTALWLVLYGAGSLLAAMLVRKLQLRASGGGL